jgi:hypothetical protein
MKNMLTTTLGDAIDALEVMDLEAIAAELEACGNGSALIEDTAGEVWRVSDYATGNEAAAAVRERIEEV